jgi:hypothetical protein
MVGNKTCRLPNSEDDGFSVCERAGGGTFSGICRTYIDTYTIIDTHKLVGGSVFGGHLTPPREEGERETLSIPVCLLQHPRSLAQSTRVSHGPVPECVDGYGWTMRKLVAYDHTHSRSAPHDSSAIDWSWSSCSDLCSTHNTFFPFISDQLRREDSGTCFFFFCKRHIGWDFFPTPHPQPFSLLLSNNWRCILYMY